MAIEGGLLTATRLNFGDSAAGKVLTRTFSSEGELAALEDATTPSNWVVRFSTRFRPGSAVDLRSGLDVQPPVMLLVTMVPPLLPLDSSSLTRSLTDDGLKHNVTCMMYKLQ